MWDTNAIYDIPEIENSFRMTKGDIDKFAECAALAYKDYPLFEYITNNKYDYKVVQTIIEASIYSMKNQIIAISNDKTANSIAIFVPPNYDGCKVFPFFVGGGIKLAFMAPKSTFLKLLNYEKYAMKVKKNYTNHKCWYLYNVTVKPQFQSKGNCSKLLKPMFNYFDRTRQDCYLETHSKENVYMYEHFGFELLETGNIPKTNIKQYSMIRKSK